MFGLDSNSIEPAAAARPVAARKPNPDEMPIREATKKEMRALRQTPQEVGADAVARRHNLYTADKRATRIYFTDYQQKSEVMRASPQRITTKLNDRQTVSAMLDLAQSRGWQSVKLRGTDSFKREAWVQAQVRGMQTEGYQPKATDKQEADRRKATVTPTAPQQASSDTYRQIDSGKWRQTQNARSENVRFRVVLGQSDEGFHARLSIEKPQDGGSKQVLDSRWSKAFPTKEQAERYGVDQAKRQIRGVAMEGHQPKQANMARPTEANAVQTAKQRQETVWGTVETAGQNARQNDASPAQKPAQKPASAAA